jgi:hypothetical protein
LKKRQNSGRKKSRGKRVMMTALVFRLPEPMLQLPPAYTLMSACGSADAFRRACDLASESGAGTFVWIPRFDMIEFAVVLEPEEPLTSARRAVLVGMNALADAIASVAPPEKQITFAWPTILNFDGARIGGSRLGWPSDCPEDTEPDWLVFATQLLGTPAPGVIPGDHPEVTWLEEEGFDPNIGSMIVEGFARHLICGFNAWNERGFATVADHYLARLPKETPGDQRVIGANGDLLVQRSGAADRIPLAPSIRNSAWLDPHSRQTIP